MQLEMKTRCEKCAALLDADREAYICSYECTFCPACAENSRHRCPHCAGELVRRPHRTNVTTVTDQDDVEKGCVPRPSFLWTFAFVFWALVTLIISVTECQFRRSIGMTVSFLSIAGVRSCQLLTYAPLTPLAFVLAARWPVQRQLWLKRSLLLLAGGLTFGLLHIILRALTSHLFWEWQFRNQWAALGNMQAQSPKHWPTIEPLSLSILVGEIGGVYLPIVLMAHAALFVRGIWQRASLTSRLEAQLAKANLRALKSQLQPHFLFNTLHSISALMLTDVVAADDMMSRLSELLRMTLDSNGAQITTLSGELEFVNGYLEIEKIRFADRLKVVLDIAPDVLDAQVPNLLLQPLVENAIRHGIARLSSDGEIRIRVSHDVNNLHIEIKDNGPGLLEPLNANSNFGLGVAATRERLRTLYGEKHAMKIRSVAQGGAEVSIQIPFLPNSTRPPKKWLTFKRGTVGVKDHAYSHDAHNNCR
jgi:two-component system LytT family sensor kinase